MGKTVLIEMEGITKVFGRTRANDRIGLRLYEGEIHALLGENGAGKSTLMNVLTGIYKPDEGNIYAYGKKVALHTPRDAAELGIGMVHQHFQLIPTLTVAENIFLGLEHTGFHLNPSKMEERIRSFSEKFGLPVEPSAKIWQLSVGEQQRVEIMKLLCRDCRILILDEPSAVLTPQEAGELFRTLRNMTDQGKSVIVISHKMNEVMENADRISVLKDGRLEDEMEASEATVERLTRAVIGTRRFDQAARRAISENARPVLAIEGLCAENDRGLPAVRDLSFDLRAGEIFGIAGVAGSGQRELAEALAGLRPAAAGKILLGEEDITRAGVRQRIGSGIAFIPEDRLQTGLVPQMNLWQNAVLKRFRTPVYSARGILRKKAVKSVAREYVESYGIKSGGMELPVGLMSGGNQQKLLVAREVDGHPQVLIAAYPVRGLDIGAAAEINRILLRKRGEGTCILLISEELDELFRMADRIGVLCDGRLMGIRRTDRTDFDEIGRMMSGEKS